jgi:hypothetical protein
MTNPVLRLRTVVLLCLTAVALVPCRPSSGQQGQTGYATTAYVIAGAALCQTSGQPISGLSVKVFAAEGTGGSPLATAVTDGLGRYKVKIERSIPAHLPASPGGRRKFSLQVLSRIGRLIKSSSRPVEVRSGQEARVEIRLTPSEIQPDAEGAACRRRTHEQLFRLVARLPSEKLVEAYLIWRNERADFRQLSTNQLEFIKLLSQDDPAHDCGQVFLSAIVSLLKARRDEHLIRQLIQELRAFPPSKFFFTEHVVVRYTTTGNSAVYSPVPTVSSELRMPNHELIGTIGASLPELHADNTEVPPVYVQQVGLIAERAWFRFTGSPHLFRDPRGGARRLEIRLQRVQKGTGMTHPLIEHIDIRPNNTLDQNFATVPHEIFHRVQYQYNRTTNASEFYSVMQEGGARFIEDSFNDEYNRYAFQSQEIFNNPTLSLFNPPGGRENPIGYAAALLWKYLAEQHSNNINAPDEPDIGVDVYRQLLETTATPMGGSPPPYKVAGLRAACELMVRPCRFDQFRYFDAEQTELDTSETAWGNYLLANYLHATPASPPGDRRFGYMEDADKVTWSLTTEELPAVSNLGSLRPHVDTENDVVIGLGSSVSRTVIGQPEYAARYYRITPDASSPPRALRVSLSAFGGMGDPLVQILRFGPGPTLVDISRSDRSAFTKSVNMRGLSSVVVIVASRANAGDYTVNFEEVPGGPDVMITRWDSALTTEYERDARAHPRSRVSLDLMVDDNDDLVPDAFARPGVDNKLKIRVRNRGNEPASGVRLDLAYQPDAARLDSLLWRPILNAAQSPQSVTGLSLGPTGGAGEEKWTTVAWAPEFAGPGRGWCVRVTVVSPGDLNSDNKVAFGCFAVSPGP